MTVVDQVTMFDADPAQDDETPIWEQYLLQRGTEDERRTCPRGTYEAMLLEVRIVRRKDGGFLLRMVSRTVGLGVFLVTWRGLSTDFSDPFDLTEVEVRSLRKFAAGMGVPVPAPAREIVEALQKLVGEQVEAKVSHSPVGIQASLSRPLAPTSTALRVAGRVLMVDGQLMDANGELLDVEGKARIAHEAHALVLEGQQLARRGLATAAAGCHALHASEGWRALGFETLSEYLAQPEVEFSRSEFYRLCAIHQAYVLDGGLAPDVIAGASPTKLELPIPAIEQGVVSAGQAAADAESMTRNDLRVHYRELLGAEPEAAESEPSVSATPAADPESRRRDLEIYVNVDEQRDAAVERLSDEVAEERTRAEAAEERERALRAQLNDLPHQTDLQHMTVAQGLALVLARVMREVGDPRQKRMGKELRAAVQAALDEAREHGLDVD